MERYLSQFLHHVRMPLFRNAYALMANQGVNSILGVAFWVAAARFFPPDEVGSNAALLSTMAFIALLSQFGMRNAMAWLLPTAGAAAGRYIGWTYLVSTGATLLIAPVVLLTIGSSDATSHLVEGGLVFMVVFTVATALSSVFALQDGVLVGLRAATWVPLENALFGILKIALLPLLIGSSLGIFSAWALAIPPLVLGANALVYLRLLRRREPTDGGSPPDLGFRHMVRFISGDYVGNLMVQGTIRLLPLLVIGSLGTVANAYSFQAWTVALPLFLVAGSMMSSLTVESLTTPAEAATYARRMLVNMGRLLVPASVLVVVAAPLVLELFGPAYADQGTLLLQLLGVSTIPITLNVWYYALCRIRGTVMPILVSQTIVAAVTVSLSLILLPVIGITGTGVGWLIGQSLAALIVVAREFRLEEAGGLRWPAGGLDRARRS